MAASSASDTAQAKPTLMAAASGMLHLPSAMLGTTDSAAGALQAAKEKLFGTGRSTSGLGDWAALDDEERKAEFHEHLPPARRRLGIALSHIGFEIALGVVLLVNFCIAVVETNAAVDGEGDVPAWTLVANVFLLLLYSIEIALRMYVYRWLYFKSAWNLLDLTVVGIDILGYLLRGALGSMPNLSVLRTVRLVRLARAYKVLIVFPELHAMVLGMASTMKTIFWGMMLLEGFLLFFSLIAVQLIHPVNRRLDWPDCSRCGRAFESVWEAHTTFFQQIVAGDSWGLVTIPIIESEPWSLLFFALVLLTINLLVINLITAVIVEKAQEAHDEQSVKLLKAQVQEKEIQVKHVQAELVKLCYQMDEDRSGNLTLNELLDGFDKVEYFANLLKSMDINRDDLRIVFSILDKDNSGDVDYAEFVEQLHRLKSQDEHTLLIFILHHVKELQSNIAAKRNLTAGSAAAAPTSSGASPAAAELGCGSASAQQQQLLDLAAKVSELNRTFKAQGHQLAAINQATQSLLGKHYLGDDDVQRNDLDFLGIMQRAVV